MSASQEVVEVEDDSGEEEEEAEAILVGCLTVNVVGLRYYHGTVTNGEMVQLVREPTNPYDSNAIRVLNIRGDQVGHVEKNKAMHLAPLVDQNLAFLEGIVPSGSKNAYRMPCQVHVFSKPALAAAVVDHLDYFGERLSGGLLEEGAHEGGGGGRASSKTSKRKVLAGAASSAPKKPSIDDIFEDLALDCKKRQAMEPDSSIVKSELMQHQKEALAWMIQRENSSALPPFWEIQPPKGSNATTMYMNTLTNFTCDKRPEPLRGGILADDMGLGKTLAVLALVATNRPGAVLPPVVDIAEELEELEEQPAAKKSKTTERSKGRDKKASDSGSDDHPPPPCVPKAGGPLATLVVCPLSVLSNWIGQLEDHTRAGSLNVCVFHGPDRIKNAKKLASHDLVFTTYNMLASEWNDRNSALRKVQWLRLVLDEAHLVKNPKAQQTKCAISLNADRRWAVTGTPIQNNAKDLFSLMQFLHFEPLSERTFWNRTIQRPLTSGQPAGFARLQGLMSAISLRRTKEARVNGKKLVDLPPKIVTVFPVDLTPNDRAIYDKMERDGKDIILKYIANGTMTKNYAIVLQIILRLRQLCDHSSMCPGSMDVLAALGAENQGQIASPELLQKMLAMIGDDFDCPICLSPPVTAIITRCAHVFCRRCIEKTLERDKRQCPMCRGDLTISDIYTSNVGEEQEEAGNDGDGGGGGSSAKITALLSILDKTRAKDPSIKTVVFSQFSSMLKLAEAPLTQAGYKFVKLQGGMSAKKRDEAMEAFKSTSKDSPTVFLLSLKAAGVGLNLVSASNVVMLDPWWNPAAEEQAMDRVHRLGQTRDVHVFRLVATDSIEERLLQMQEKKRAYAQIALGKEASEERRKQCIQEVRLLMQC
ncbi:helicase-like transcription factor [Selaginella moellendorffii]|uniref:helicase-like transcription factor n=1 Tax=Selaginella moellendorffii TaxID=88036 RepID=UPI000D1CE4CC|nr:helicase-like transcription factor [Selaginella moellendorffii]|eukprot:XP_024516582.1 helicase-like transcription factor [Selaginella moellendorffii]